jgi:hypothetical protein
MKSKSNAAATFKKLNIPATREVLARLAAVRLPENSQVAEATEASPLIYKSSFPLRTCFTIWPKRACTSIPPTAAASRRLAAIALLQKNSKACPETRFDRE